MMIAPKVARLSAKSDACLRNEPRKPRSLFASQRASVDAGEAQRKLREGSRLPEPLPPIRPRLIQPKLRVGPVDDPLEQEADRVSESVMRMGSVETVPSASPPQISRKCAACEEEATSEPTLQVNRKCTACEKEEHEAPLQRKSAEPSTSSSLGKEAPPAVHDVLLTAGQPLDQSACSFFEPRLGFDLSHVRIHTDPRAAESARSVGALAYTAGSDIAFAAGHYQPETDGGRRLIAHELAHVIQQSGGDRGYLRRLGGGAGGDGTPQQTDTGRASPPERSGCAVNAGCPDDYCLPFPTRQAALDDRTFNAESVLSTISSANAHAEPLFRKFVFSPGPAGDISAEYAADFTSSRTTRDATEDVSHLLEIELRSHPPTFPPGTDHVTVDIDTDPSRESLKRQINQLATTRLVFTSPIEVPALLAGGINLGQASCNVGANTSGAQDDSRSARVRADVFRNPDGTLLITPEIRYTVVDTIDFCPGNCGGFFAQRIGQTVRLSRWEASAISGDVPFTVHFPAPSLVGAYSSED